MFVLMEIPVSYTTYNTSCAPRMTPVTRLGFRRRKAATGQRRTRRTTGTCIAFVRSGPAPAVDWSKDVMIQRTMTPTTVKTVFCSKVFNLPPSRHDP